MKNAYNIGKVVESDFNHKPGSLNNVSDINISNLQYTSPIIEKMKEDQVYDSLCHLVRSVKMADKSDSFLIRLIKERFKSYCGALNINTFRRWLGYYRELRESYYFGRDIALGELLAIGMNVARTNNTTLEGGEFALKLIDRIDNGVVNPRNILDTSSSKNNNSSETSKTLGKLILELSDISEPINEEDEEEDDD